MAAARRRCYQPAPRVPAIAVGYLFLAAMSALMVLAAVLNYLR
jgi:hypothetical protein